MKKAIKNILLKMPAIVSALTLLASCGAEAPVNRTYPCRFYLDTRIHPVSKLITAVTSYNYYVKTTVDYRSGAFHVVTYSRDGQNNPEDLTLTAQTEIYAFTGGIYLGANKSIIVGLTNFNGPVAYDGMCPNCIEQYASVDFPLSWNTTVSEVKCDKCKRTYSLETGTITGGNNGKPLMRYLVNYTGPYSMLRIGN
ncbi:MAG: hypothetical protein KIC64_12020 [Prevotella buccae]|uniref:hypothetical protein n=1 Tax=Segatella buccae TaxID=28126 RepID=UPI0001C413FA|nr:hypothetical protein [Segatella buccae]EFC74716.1 hypothetical protein HMPREF0649_02307 [Segatella buccae D17]MBS5896532.1 hypothetical protein [Segatella buccae]